MISYKPFWLMLEQRKISTYSLIKDYHIGRSLVDKLKHNKGLTTSTIDMLCATFNCSVSNIMEYIEEHPKSQ